MSLTAQAERTAQRVAMAGRVGVIDIGSNSVRLVVYDKVIRVPVALFNEKVLCGLGRRLASTGQLDAAAMEHALATLRRFAALARAMALDTLEVVATAAVRDAANGAAFVTEAERICRVPVRVLSGAEEAHLSALGVAAGIPDARGLVGDLGGGSLELVAIDGTEQEEGATLPLGPLRLADEAGEDRALAKRRIDAALARLPWLPRCRGQAFYAVGGVWRAIGRIDIARSDHPLHILHQYVMPARRARDLCRLLARQSPKSLEQIPAAPRRRLDVLPLGALVLDRLIKASGVDQVVISANGLREGLLYDHLPPEIRAQDPLLALCRLLALRLGRFPDHAEELVRWTAPLFPGEAASERRLRTAACLIGDIGWRIHPDYRAEHSMEEVLRAPLAAITHPERAALALSLCFRYDPSARIAQVDRLMRLLDEADLARARVIGLSLRLGHALSGAAPGVLDRCPLRLEEGALVLHLPGRCADLAGDAVLRRLEALGAALGRTARLDAG